MGLVGMLAGFGMGFFLLRNFAIYVLPAFVGFSAGWWALNHDAGIGCVLVGLVAGVVTFLAGRAAIKSRNVPLFWAAIALFTLLAAYAFYNIVLEVSEAGVPSTVWRHIFAVVGATLLAGATFKQLIAEDRP